MSSRAIFLDKDGTLIKDVAYNVDPARIVLSERSALGLRALAAAGYRLFVISNQSGVARGYFPEDALAAVEDTLRALLQAQGIVLSGFYYCPHHPEGTLPQYRTACDCRKPHPGLLFAAAREHALHLPDCWLIGDILDDIEAGSRAGCRTVLIDNGGETEWQLSPLRAPTAVAPDIDAAAELILATAEMHADAVV